jgi:hypothetical protein
MRNGFGFDTGVILEFLQGCNFINFFDEFVLYFIPAALYIVTSNGPINVSQVNNKLFFIIMHPVSFYGGFD